MRHLDDKTAMRLALDEADAGERAALAAHLERCDRCRARVEETREAWVVFAADPSADLPDTPVWPGVAAALERPAAAVPAAPRLRAGWRLALAEAWRRPLAYAAIAVLIAGIGGGHLGGRVLMGSSSGPLTADAGATVENLLDYSALDGLPAGSFSAAYFGADEDAAEAATGGGENGR